MGSCFRIGVAVLSFFVFCGFGTHKFYMSIYQVHFAESKQRLEITGRIFIDDLNDCLSKSVKVRTHVGEKGQTAQDLECLERYFGNQFRIKVNSDLKPMKFLSCETEEDVVVCYFRIDGVTEVKSLEVRNAALMSCQPDQQNVIQTKVYGTKKDLLLTASESTGKVDFDIK